LLDPDADEQVCVECSAGAIFINPDSRDYFARLYRVPARTTCLDADPMPRRYMARISVAFAPRSRSRSRS